MHMEQIEILICKRKNQIVCDVSKTNPMFDWNIDM